MSKFIAGALLFLLITALLWTSVLWHWESTRHNMSVSDIVIYLGLLPLACFGLLLALRWAWHGAGERQAAAAARASGRAGGNASPQPPLRAHRPRRPAPSQSPTAPAKKRAAMPPRCCGAPGCAARPAMPPPT
mgnify:CR=1 FL=1